jgi:AhpD family alkylhydroperoxidase
MQTRMKNPAGIIPDATQALQALSPAVHGAGAPGPTLALVHLRTSQINGCSACIDYGFKAAKQAGESDERLFAVSAWREAPYFSDAERAALALSEAMTRLSDSSDPVPDKVWNEAAKHYDEKALAALVLWIATTNLYNRVNVTTRQPAGVSWK